MESMPRGRRGGLNRFLLAQPEIPLPCRRVAIVYHPRPSFDLLRRCFAKMMLPNRLRLVHVPYILVEEFWSSSNEFGCQRRSGEREQHGAVQLGEVGILVDVLHKPLSLPDSVQ